MKATVVHSLGVVPMEVNEVVSRLTSVTVGKGTHGQVLMGPALLMRTMADQKQAWVPIYINHANSMEELEGLRQTLHDNLDKMFDEFAEVISEVESKEASDEKSTIPGPGRNSTYN